MKVLILGSSGILGQHMRLNVPDLVTPIWHRRKADMLHVGCDLMDRDSTMEFLGRYSPEVIVNLAGESRPDVVEKDPASSEWINAHLPIELAVWCEEENRRLIQVSTQAVFSGDDPPYSPMDERQPVNEYGRQKTAAEDVLAYACATVVRPTFVLGVRPLPHVGRANPVEQMFAGQSRQVGDRHFSPLFAEDAARLLWRIVLYGSQGDRVVHLGIPVPVSRSTVAGALGLTHTLVSHDEFPGIAPRPKDTTYDVATARNLISWRDGIRQVKADWDSRMTHDLEDKAIEIALFLGISKDSAVNRLGQGFGKLHQDVTIDFRRVNPQDDQALLEWYRRTEAYLWELSAYHADPGFNYMGMCRGISDRLKSLSAKTVLVLGDGVGTMTLYFAHEGMDATYHDLAGSRTAAFAAFRYWRQFGKEMPVCLTPGWAPELAGQYDAIVCSDFLEHVTDVPAWVAAIKGCLKPGGVLFSQNAFGPAMGSGVNGSIPMHLSRNDHYEKDWDPMLSAIGFTQDSSNWYRSAA